MSGLLRNIQCHYFVKPDNTNKNRNAKNWHGSRKLVFSEDQYLPEEEFDKRCFLWDKYMLNNKKLQKDVVAEVSDEEDDIEIDNSGTGSSAETSPKQTEVPSLKEVAREEIRTQL